MIAPAALAGRWRLDRAITDRLSGQAGWFRGEALLSPEPWGLAYAETGQLQIGGGPVLQAERRYRWLFDGSQVAVFFADGAPFHRFTPGETEGQIEHLCGADSYRVTYHWDDWPRWRAHWQVSGPRKDYALDSRYAPLVRDRLP
jgi:hypothetical protein